jgi:hypothetical protein
MADILASGTTSPLGKVRLESDYFPYVDQGSMPFPIMLGDQGGIGFQFSGGIITVVATSPQIEVSFDRPMVFNGSYSGVPGGTPYDIGAPTLTVSARALDIPITVPPQTFGVSSIVVGTTSITVNWAVPAAPISYTNSGWYISTSDGTPVTIVSLASGGASSTIINTTEHTGGAHYTLHIPAGSVLSADNTKLNVLYTNAYVGTGIAPSIYTVRVLNLQSFLVTFTEPMDPVTATNPAHYVVPGLTINSVSQVDATNFVVFSSPMTPNTGYVLTVTGVLDASQNPIS